MRKHELRIEQRNCPPWERAPHVDVEQRVPMLAQLRVTKRVALFGQTCSKLAPHAAAEQPLGMRGARHSTKGTVTDAEGGRGVSENHTRTLREL
jgi:hypothetical protein